LRRLVVLVSLSAFLALPMPASAASRPIIGLWPEGTGGYAEYLEIANGAGVEIPYFRGRQRDGQFDADRELVMPEAEMAAAAGLSIGMNIQPKTGNGQNRVGVLYTDISAQIRAGSGPLYDKLVSMANEVLALPFYGEVTYYLQFHSEPNIQGAPGVPAAQPFSGTAAEYQECYALIRELFDSLGVTDRIQWQIVLSRSAYAGGVGSPPTNWFPEDESLYDLVGVDAYYRGSDWRSPEESFGPALEFARSVGKPLWIDEVGADEGGPDQTPTAKAEWFGELGAFLETNADDIAGVVFSHAGDGGNWFVDSVFDLVNTRARGGYTGTTWDAWMALAQGITAPVSVPDSDHTVAYDGWRGVLDATASGGSYRLSDDPGDQVSWVSPAATSVTWLARTGPDLGIVEVRVDGNRKGTVDLYTATPGARSISFGGLRSAKHRIVIDVLGTKQAASTGTGVTVDGFSAAGTTTDERSTKVRFNTWRGESNKNATDGAFRVTNVRDSTVTVTFTGRGIDWIATGGRGYGMASVSIDGAAHGVVDLYRSATTWKIPIEFTDLPAGRHTLTITVLGTKNPSATGRSVAIDGFVVHG
jgi:hypothetical protein